MQIKTLIKAANELDKKTCKYHIKEKLSHALGA